MAFISFLKQLLFIDQSTGKLSHTRWWSNVGTALACYLFYHQVIANQASTELWIVFGTLVMGNATANKVISMMFHIKTNEVKDANK